MIFSLLPLALLLISTVSAEVNCTGDRPQNVPSIASCDIALQHLARYLLPCLAKDTVKVGQYGSRVANVRLPAIFADKTAYRTPTPACMIEFFWDGPDGEVESIAPSVLHAYAMSMNKQCIAAKPPRFAQGRIEPSGNIFVKFEGAWVSGDTTLMVVNGTQIPVDLPPVNPRDACRSPLDGVDMEGPPPLVESS